MSEAESILKRGNVWQFFMRVPVEYAAIDKRTFIKFSLKTSDKSEALRRSAEARERLFTLWQAQSLGHETVSVEKFEAIVKHCQALGFQYKPLGALSDEEIVKRVVQTEAMPEESAIAAVGVARQPTDSSKNMFELFEKTRAVENANKSKHQLRVWKNPFLRALELFHQVNEEKPIEDISRNDALAVHSHLSERLLAKEIGASSANRIMTSLSSMWNSYAKRAQLDAQNPFRNLHIKEKKKTVRPPVPEDYIKRALKPGALDNLNSQCRAILLTVINTGCRPSEIIGLEAQHIHLAANIPYIQIKPDGRDLKTDDSERDVPLLGVALEAMRAHPQGFPEYRDRPLSATANINKFIKNNKLVPCHPDDEKKSLTCYSYRHSFQDRLTAAEVPERIARDLMGHRLKGERYGDGASLEHKARILEAISFF